MQPPADQVLDREHRALVGHVHHLRAGHDLEHFAAEVRQRAGAAGAVVEAVRRGLRVGDQVLQRFHRQRRVDHDQLRRRADQRNRLEVAQRHVSGFVEQRVDHDRRDAADHQRIAVGQRFGRDLGAEAAAGTGTVVDHHALVPRLDQLLADDAGDDVGGAARRVRRDHADRLGGISLARDGAGCQRKRQQCDPARATNNRIPAHRISPRHDSGKRCCIVSLRSRPEPGNRPCREHSMARGQPSDPDQACHAIPAARRRGLFNRCGCSHS